MTHSSSNAPSAIVRQLIEAGAVVNNPAYNADGTPATTAAANASSSKPPVVPPSAGQSTWRPAKVDSGKGGDTAATVSVVASSGGVPAAEKEAGTKKTTDQGTNTNSTVIALPSSFSRNAPATHTSSRTRPTSESPLRLPSEFGSDLDMDMRKIKKRLQHLQSTRPLSLSTSVSSAAANTELGSRHSAPSPSSSSTLATSSDLNGAMILLHKAMTASPGKGAILFIRDFDAVSTKSSDLFHSIHSFLSHVTPCPLPP